MTKTVFIGTDGGATTSKVGGVWSDGSTISTKLLQASTNSKLGPQSVVQSWVEAISNYLSTNGLTWDQVGGVGLAVPGPFQRYGVFDHSANLPDSFTGFDVHTVYTAALSERAGRSIHLTVGNDGDMGGVAEAQHARGESLGTVVMLAPGSGLGCAYIDQHGFALSGDTFAGMEAGHMPALLHLLGAKPYTCGCGRDWGCIEMYTCLAGLHHLLADKLEQYPDHDLAKSTLSMKERAFSLRGLAQKGDTLAQEIFDFQAKALGLHVANLAMPLDPKFVVIGGGLMDPEATTPAFRERYLSILRSAAREYLWPYQKNAITIVPAALGDLSQAIGAALTALYMGRA